MEVKLERFRALYESMLKLSRNFTASDYDPSVTESVKDAMGKLNDLVVRPMSGGNKNGASADNESTPRTFAHAMARATGHHALHLGDNEPLGAALMKLSDAENVLGNAKLKLVR